MEKRLSRWGIGPMITSSSALYAAAAALATYQWRDICFMSFLPYGLVMAVGGILIVLGLAMWFIGGATAMRAYNRDQLVTSGVFALVRHPIYSAWIVFLLPGLALLTRSWPLLLTPLVAYAVFKSKIHREDEYLRQRFGQSYLDYRLRVNEVCPFPALWRRASRDRSGGPRPRK